jgi:hypothetical protein
VGGVVTGCAATRGQQQIEFGFGASNKMVWLASSKVCALYGT